MPARLAPLVAALLLLIILPASAQDGTQPIVASDLLRIQQLGDVAVSPDGRSVVYSVRSVEEQDDEENEYRYVTQLWAIDSGGRGDPRQLTFAREGASQPAWHPNSDRLAFVRSVDGKAQVFVLSMLGGEARQVTEAEHGASNPTWSPDGDAILFASSLPEVDVREQHGPPTWPQERPGQRPAPPEDAGASPDGSISEIRAWLDENEREAAPRVVNRINFQGEQDLEPGLSFRHFYLTRRDTAGVWSDLQAITEGWASYSSAAWHPDGERILLAGWQEPTAHPDRTNDSNIYITYVNEPRPRPLFSIEDHAVSAPTVSPDGQTIAFVARDRRDPGFAQTEVGIFPIDAPSESRILTAGFDRSVGTPRWAPDNWHIYFTAASEGAFPLFRVRAFEDPPQPEEPDEELDALPDTLTVADAEAVEPDRSDQPQVERLTDLESGVRAFDLSSATLYYVSTRVENPYELYAMSAPFESGRRLTQHNASWLASKRVSRPVHATVTSDTFSIDYWVMQPTFAEDGRRYPMLLQMHGGPSAMWGPGEASMWHEFQFFASQGYVVVYANPRGSGGYGYAFQRANFQDWGTGPASDVLAVADEAAVLPSVDPAQQVLTGGSYAGYLTAWIVSQDNRFRAAVAQRGVYDLTTFFGEGNAWRLVPSHFGGYPWETDPEFVPPPDDPFRPSPELAVRLEQMAGDTLEAELPTPRDEEVEEELLDDAAEVDDAMSPESFREILIRNSPLSYVAQIETPLLIIHSDEDLRTGVIQSEMLYRSLKLLDKPVEYVRYPRSGHELSRSGEPRLRMDRILRIYEFMERFVD